MYCEEIADMMILKAERLDVEESEYISYQSGQPSRSELEVMLALRIPGKTYQVTEHINGTTIKRIESYECESSTSGEGC